MRIAFMVDGFAVLSETFIVTQIRGVIERGHDVDIFACSPPPLASFNAAVSDDALRRRVRYLSTPPSMWRRARYVAGTVARYGRAAPKLCWRSFNIVRFGRMAASARLYCSAAPFMEEGPGRYDVVHCQFGPLGRLALRLRQIGALHGALITAFRGYDATRYLRLHPHAYDELFREGEAFLPVSQALGDALIAHGCPTDRTEVQHSGIDLRHFQYRARGRDAREPVRVVTVARLVEKKGVEYAIDAVARLVHDGYAVAYDIIGDGAQRAQLERRIAAHGLTRHVRLLGWRQPDHARALLDRAHILIAPSVTASDGDQEGIPNALKEAMAMGIPVVATRHGGNAELVEHDVSGLLAPERDAAALSACLAQLIAMPERWPAIGLAGRRKIEAEFDSRRLSVALDEIYRRARERRVERVNGRRAEWARAADGTR